ncbi:MAG: SpoIIE family protein phosphatase, partial [Ignavibacteriaceae bacterium]|nr:SpoIIE family protein phosphatase [Ignavibacteriaceae bacterium]
SMQPSQKLTAQEKYQLLREISFKIKDTFDLDIILNLLLDTLKTVMNYDAAGIFILSESILDLHYKFPGQKISGIARRGYKRVDETDEMLIQGKGIIGHVIKTGESLIIDDVRIEPRYVVGRTKTLSEITVPITIDDRVIGALDVESDRLSAFNMDDLELLKFFTDASAISIEKAILHQQILEKKKLEEQMQIAKDVQSSLLPTQPPIVPGYDIDAICIPTYEIGGDYFDYIPINNKELGIVLADVSGDGVPAALIMAAFRAIIRNQVRINPNPEKVMNYLNEQLPDFSRKRDFITTIYGSLDFKNHKFTYTNCGHNVPLVINSAGSLENSDEIGPSLNLVKNVEYKFNTINVQPGEVIAIYTDGVTEIFNDTGEEYGIERLKNVLVNSVNYTSRDIIENVVNSTKDFSQQEFYRDDFTILVLKRNKN